MSAAVEPLARPLTASPMRPQMRRFLAVSGVTMLAITVVSAFLMPLAFMLATAFKQESQLTAPGAPLYPAVPETFTYQGEEYPVYAVPSEDGVHAWALRPKPHREDAIFIDPANPAAGPIEWEGRWRTLTQSWRFELRFENFTTAWDRIDFPRLFFNTIAIAGLSTLGAVLSAICVAYGFSRFRFPGRDGLFVLMLATIILPFQVTLIPSYAVYLSLGWVGTWLPLIIPHFFSNAYNVFLLRQYFLTIPRELDEAAMIDGAGPFRILVSVIVPQAKAAIVAVTLFHFFFAWNEYFLPLIYLQGAPELQPLSVGLGRFQALYSQESTLIQAAAIMAMILPVAVFFLAQRAFMRGVVDDRRREVTVDAVAVDAVGVDPVEAAAGVPRDPRWSGGFAIPAAAWTRSIGEPYAEAGRPRVDQPMVDDGPWGGVPLGGLGSGSIGRTHRGDFARWHLDIGTHRFEPMAGCQFSVYCGPVDASSGRGSAHVLTTWRPEAGELPGWGWDMPLGAGRYHGLFPRAWFVYEWDRLPVRIAQSQFSPVIAGNVREASYPVGLFEWRVENPTDQPLRVGVMLSWENVFGAGSHRARRDGPLVGVTLDGPASDPSQQFAIVAIEEDGAEATTWTRFDVRDGGDLWRDFASDGALRDAPSQTAPEGARDGAAVALTVELAPGERRALRFALAWDIPQDVRFGAGTAWYRRYTRFFGRGGGSAWEIATDGLANQQRWERSIEEWQAPILADPGRPDWYAMALFNELYILVDGGTAWEDGCAGVVPPAEGDGRFAFLECYDYPFYDTHDVLFYASYALALLWPSLERRTLRSLVESVAVEDRSLMTLDTTGELVQRKRAGAVPHDLGAPAEDPFLRINAYRYRDTNRWKDLNSKFVLQLWRDRVLLRDPELVRSAWPAVVQALDFLAAFDIDGDGLPDHGGEPDQTFDTWPMAGPSAYAGGLWLAALMAAVEMANEVGDTAAAARYGALLECGRRGYERLWTGSYLLYDGSGGPHSDSVMADQLCGQWYADATGLGAVLDAGRVATALQTIVERNVRGFGDGRMGAVNGTRPDGSVDGSSEQSAEVWSGVTYALAALLLHRGMDEMAWEVARGAVAVTYERGFWFRTPEAWDANGDFRASLYMRPLSIWAMEHALRVRAGAGGGRTG